MIKLVFTYNGFDEAFFLEGKMIPSEDFATSIQGEWNNEIYDIQHLIYNAYSIKVYVRDAEYQRFQKIKSSTKIIIWEGSIVYNLKLVSFISESLVNEFWECDIVVRDIGSKAVNNVILTNVEDVMDFSISTTSLQTFNIQTRAYNDVLFTQNRVDNFKDKVPSYNKSEYVTMVRLYLLASELSTFYGIIEDINLLSAQSILIGTTEYNQFEILKELIGYDLYEISMTLFNNNIIST